MSTSYHYLNDYFSTIARAAVRALLLPIEAVANIWCHIFQILESGTASTLYNFDANRGLPSWMLFANNVPSCATATPNNTFSWTSTRLTYPSPRASASAALALHPDERPVFPLDLDGSTRVSRRETCRRCEGGPRAWRCRVGLRYVLSRPDCFKRALWLMSTPRFSSFVLFWQVDDRLMVLSVRLLVVPSRRSPRHRGCAAARKKASSRTGSDVIKAIAMGAQLPSRVTRSNLNTQEIIHK
jgi:hypothetical protein